MATKKKPAPKKKAVVKKKSSPKKPISKKPVKKPPVKKPVPKAKPQGKPKPKKKRKASLLDKRVGNEFWKKRIKHGRDKIFSTPEMLWDCCCEYFKWVEKNPLQETLVKTPSGKVEKVEVPKMRAMTIEGLCLFLGVGTSTWHDYSERDDFSDICKIVEDVMVTQKFSGAAAGFLNHAIIARHLGLVDKKELSGGLSVISMDDKDKDA